MSKRGVKRLNRSDKDEDGEWRMTGIDPSKLLKMLPKLKDDCYGGEKWKGYLVIGGIRNCKISEVGTSNDRSTILSFGNGSDRVNVTMYTTRFDIKYTEMIPEWVSGGKKISRDGRSFDLVQSETKSASPDVFSFTIGDLIRANYYFNRSNMGGVEIDPREVELEKRRERILTSRGATPEYGSEDIAAKKFSERKKELQRNALKSDSFNDNTKFLGYVSHGTILKLSKMEPLMKTGIDDFLKTRIVVGDQSGMNNSLQDDYYDWKLRKRVKQDDQTKRENFADWFMKIASDSLIDRFVNYFYFGKNAYNSFDNEILFDEPITMKEFIDLIDERQVKDGWKKWLERLIFKDCNPRERTILEKQEEMIIDDFKKLERVGEHLPPYCFRKLRFSKFSDDMVRDLKYAINDSINEGIIPKRWRNKKDRAIREDWKIERSGTGYFANPKFKSLEKHSDKFHKNSDFYNDTKDAILEMNEDDSSSGWRVVSMDCEDEPDFVYSVPERIPEGDIEGELYRFWNDSEALAKAIEIEEDMSMSLSQKVDQFNLIGYSRAGEGDNTEWDMYVLVPPGYELKIGFKEMMECEEFYVPSVDKRLPKIVLMRL